MSLVTCASLMVAYAMNIIARGCSGTHHIMTAVYMMQHMQ